MVFGKLEEATRFMITSTTLALFSIVMTSEPASCATQLQSRTYSSSVMPDTAASVVVSITGASVSGTVVSITSGTAYSSPKMLSR